MNVAEVLDGAADLLVRDGWYRHGQEQPILNSSCVANAIGRVEMRDEAYMALLRALGAPAVIRGGWHAPIWHWNDAPGRTAAEVVAMLRAVAATERARAARLLPVVRETEAA